MITKERQDTRKRQVDRIGSDRMVVDEEEGLQSPFLEKQMLARFEGR